VAEAGTELVPVDSEHSAAFQAIAGADPSAIERIVLTASGGPFRTWSLDELERATPQQALMHPNWSMGPKITIDSATLMNKGLEVIEARWLFGVRADQIDVVIHPQSVVHSMVELTDGSIIAQLGVTDMRLPIQYAFSYPDRWPSPLPTLDLTRAERLDFALPDRAAFPCLDLACRALEAERSLPVVLNAANEIAVARFLEGRIGFSSIPRVIGETMSAHRPSDVPTLAEVRSVDRWAREHADEIAGRLELRSV
jgi:1-deoxy-D-xylulose-5-phosphate reductoisomerase